MLTVLLAKTVTESVCFVRGRDTYGYSPVLVATLVAVVPEVAIVAHTVMARAIVSIAMVRAIVNTAMVMVIM